VDEREGTRVTYAIAENLDHALGLLRDGRSDVMAGGTDYFPARPKTGPAPSIVDVSRIAEMRGITRTPDEGWRIGGATTWTELVRAELPAAFDGLKAAAREVGSIQIQNVGTLAGNLCNASPAADGVPCLLSLDAKVELSHADGKRVLPLSDFLTGVRQTVLRPAELLSAILIPPQDPRAQGAFEKLGSRRYLVISITMVGTVMQLTDEGRIDAVRIAVGACAPTAQRQPTLERRLVGQRPSEVFVTPDDLEQLAPIDDIRGDATYRLQAVCEQIQRALRKACPS
jgi:CO/xanthine dehydrogenase FAD-binding subunit